VNYARSAAVNLSNALEYLDIAKAAAVKAGEKALASRIDAATSELREVRDIFEDPACMPEILEGRSGSRDRS